LDGDFSKWVADQFITGKTAEEIRKTFHVLQDQWPSKEEEIAIKEEFCFSELNKQG